MSDIVNQWHTHGDSGQKPPDNTEWSGGDQYEAQYVDYLWDQQAEDRNYVNDQLTKRSQHHRQDGILDGLRVNQVANTDRDITVTASDGAYVEGEFTGPITESTITLGTNGSSSSRTDYVYITKTGNINVSSGSEPSTSEYIVAEVDVNTSSVITDVRRTATTYGTVGATGSYDTERGAIGDGRYNYTSGQYAVHTGGDYKPLMFADGRQQWTDDHDADGNDLINVGNVIDESDTSFEDKFINSDGDDVYGPLDLNDNQLKHAESLSFERNDPDIGSGNDAEATITFDSTYQFFALSDENENTSNYAIELNEDSFEYYGDGVYHSGNFNPSNKSDSDHDHSGDNLGDSSPLASISAEQTYIGDNWSINENPDGDLVLRIPNSGQTEARISAPTDGSAPARLTTGIVEADRATMDQISVDNRGAFLSMSSDQTLSSGSFFRIQFDSAILNHDNEWDTANYTFSPTTAGYYWIAATLGTATVPADTEVALRTNINGGNGNTNYTTAPTQNPETVTTMRTEYLEDDDTLTALALQISGADQTIRSNRTKLAIRRL